MNALFFVWRRQLSFVVALLFVWRRQLSFVVAFYFDVVVYVVQYRPR